MSAVTAAHSTGSGESGALARHSFLHTSLSTVPLLILPLLHALPCLLPLPPLSLPFTGRFLLWSPLYSKKAASTYNFAEFCNSKPGKRLIKEAVKSYDAFLLSFSTFLDDNDEDFKTAKAKGERPVPTAAPEELDGDLLERCSTLAVKAQR